MHLLSDLSYLLELFFELMKNTRYEIERKSTQNDNLFVMDYSIFFLDGYRKREQQQTSALERKIDNLKADHEQALKEVQDREQKLLKELEAAKGDSNKLVHLAVLIQFMNS